MPQDGHRGRPVNRSQFPGHCRGAWFFASSFACANLAESEDFHRLSDVLESFDRTAFTHAEVTRPVFRSGQGPGIVVMHEIPGIYPAVAAFAERLVESGFRVALPELFGQTGRPISGGYAAGQLLRACISREFHVLASRQSSPVTDWLRALCRDLHAECGGPGVGAIGMCLTGNFALALMVEPVVMAPVLSQPSLPFPLGARRRRGLHLSDSDLAHLRQRVCQEGRKVLGLRFTNDRLVPAERFERLRAELGKGFEAIEIDSSSGNPHGLASSAHSVVTNDLVDEAGHPTRVALDRVISFFQEELGA